MHQGRRNKTVEWGLSDNKCTHGSEIWFDVGLCCTLVCGFNTKSKNINQVKIMEFTSHHLSTDDLLKLKCDSCKNFLSVFPICISGDKKNICGRCSENLADGSYAHNTVYEISAQFIKFPCRYNHEGCLENFTAKHMADHEKTCNFQTMKCPIGHFTGIQCDWKGSTTSNIHHCLSKHSDLVLNEAEFNLELSKSYQCENLMKHNSLLFVVEQKFFSINKLMVLSIYNHKNDLDFKELTCELTFKTTNRSLFIKCLVTNFENKKGVEIFLDSLKEPEVVSTNVIVNIHFDVSSDIKCNTVDLNVNEPLLETLKCSACKQYVLPPIYIRQDNLYCVTCDTTRNVFARTKSVRDYRLEQIANLLDYPCKHRNNGCLFISKPIEMNTHLKCCLYGNQDCPLKEYNNCTWTDSGYNIPAHVCNAHKTMILNSPVITAELTSKIQCYIAKFSGRLFRIVFTNNDTCLIWDVQMIGPFEDGYMFEVEVLDTEIKDNGLLIKRACQTLGSIKDILAQKRCYFNRDQIENFILDKKITFKINLYQQAAISK